MLVSFFSFFFFSSRRRHTRYWRDWSSDVCSSDLFGIPGGAILPAYDPLFDSHVRHVLVRHEQGAGHAAQGYAQATGRVGVCMATSGPGATNLVTPLADAYMDSVPIVAITGQVPTAAIGTDAFQEADIRGITMPITKHNFLVTDAREIPQRIAEAFHLASRSEEHTSELQSRQYLVCRLLL